MGVIIITPSGEMKTGCIEQHLRHRDQIKYLAVLVPVFARLNMIYIDVNTVTDAPDAAHGRSREQVSCIQLFRFIPLR